MKRHATVAGLAAILLGCNQQGCAPEAARAPKTDRNPSAVAAESGPPPADIAAAPSQPSPSASSIQPRSSTSTKPAADGTVPTAESVQQSVLDELDRQAAEELERGPLSPATQLHAQYKEESRESEWADFVEENLKRHFLNRKFRDVNVVQIGCKTSVCELLAVAPDNAPGSAALTAWQQELFGLAREQWWQYAQIDRPSFQVSSGNDGRSVFVTHLTRKSKAGTRQ